MIMKQYKFLILLAFSIISQVGATAEYSSSSTIYKPLHGGYPGSIDEAAKLDKPVLIIIDMQPYFYKRELASTPESAKNMVHDEVDNLNQKIAKHIRNAKKNGQTIIFVEYENNNADPNDIKTNEFLTNQIKEYPHSFTVRKKRDDGSKEIIVLLEEQKLTNELQICGQYADACVTATIQGLTKALPNRSILVLSDACRSTAYTGNNHGTIYECFPGGVLKRSRSNDFFSLLDRPKVTLSHVPKELFLPLKKYLGLPEASTSENDLIWEYFALLKEAKIKSSENFNQDILLLFKNGNPLTRIKMIDFLSIIIIRNTKSTSAIIVDSLNDTDPRVAEAAYKKILYLYRNITHADDAGINKIIELIENKNLDEQVIDILSKYRFSIPKSGLEKILNYTKNPDQKIKETAACILSAYIKKLVSIIDTKKHRLPTLNAFNYYESKILQDSFDPEKARIFINDLLNLFQVDQDAGDYIEIIPSAFGFVRFEVTKR